MAEKKGAISRIQLSNASNGDYYVLRDEETRAKIQTDLQTFRTEIGTKVTSNQGWFTSAEDAQATVDTTGVVPLLVGEPTGYHLEIDKNEILAKASKNTASELNLNPEGGNVKMHGNIISGEAITKNTVWAAPNGSNGEPKMRALVAADIPTLDASKIASGQLKAKYGGTGTDNTSITANTVFAGPNGSKGTATFRKLVAADIPTISATKITSGNLGANYNTEIEAFNSQISAGTNFTVNTGAVRRYGRLIWLIAYITYNKAFTIYDNGGITELTLGTVKSGYIPNGNSCIWTGMLYYGTANETKNSRHRVAVGHIGTDGKIYAQAVAGGAITESVRAGAQFQFTAMYYHNTPA